jgi:hypothetical protein
MLLGLSSPSFLFGALPGGCAVSDALTERSCCAFFLAAGFAVGQNTSAGSDVCIGSRLTIYEAEDARRIANIRCGMLSKVNPRVEQVIARTVGSRPRGRDRCRSCGMSQDAEPRSHRKLD